MEDTIEMLKQKARDSWSGSVGEGRAERLEEFLRNKLAEYSEALGFSQEEILASMEKRRDYSAINYYQESTFPSLDGVRVFETQDELMAAVPNKRFRCPSCGGVSTNPYTCNTGIERADGSECDWKAYGLFGTFGKGLRFTIKDKFLEAGLIDEIFMPLDFEKADKAA